MKNDDICHVGFEVSYPIRKTEAFRGTIEQIGGPVDVLHVKAAHDKALTFRGYNGYGIKASKEDTQNLLTELINVTTDDEIVNFINKWGFFILLPDENFVSFEWEQIRDITSSIKDLVLLHAALEIDQNAAVVAELYKKLDEKIIHFDGYRGENKVVDFTLKAKEIIKPIGVDNSNIPQLAKSCRECWLISLLKAFPVKPAYSLKSGRFIYICPDFMRALLVTLAATDFSNYVLEKGKGNATFLLRI